MKTVVGAGWLKDLNDNFAEVAYAHVRPPIFVDTFISTPGNGYSGWANALDTMEEALENVLTGGKIYFRGDIREELVGSNLKFDVTIEGVGALHHPDLPAAGYDGAGACWRPPATPTAATQLIKVRGRGWTFKNILFDIPVDAAAVYLERNAESGEDEYDASHASFLGCDFRNGLYAIQDVGGCWNVRVQNGVFETIDATGGCAIINTSTAVAVPRRWIIENNLFQPDCSTEGNLQHIDSPLNGSLVRRNVFGTVKSTGIYVDLTGGTGNVVTQNTLGGAYDTSDYVAGSGDNWCGNYAPITATTAPYGLTVAVPAA